MGGTHVRLASSLDCYELVAVCDIAQGALARTAEATGAKAFSDTAALFTSGIADAVVLATPPWLHLEQARAAIECGLHVYCEKPIAPTAAEGDEIARLAARAGRVVQVGFQHRFQHSFATAKALSAEIGILSRATLTSTGWFRPQAYFDARPWRGRWREAGGGVLMNQAVHHVDAYLWIAGSPASVTARAYRTRHRVEVEDDAVAVLEFAGGARGVVTASTSDPVGSDRLELHGELGSLVVQGQRLRHARLPEPAQQISDTCPDAFPRIEVAWEDVAPAGLPTDFAGFVSACHRDFVDAVEGGTGNVNHAAEATRAVELANAVYLSAVTGETVPLPLDRDAYAECYARLVRGDVELP